MSEPAKKDVMKPRKWGIAPEELAKLPTVYRSDLFEGQSVMLSGGGSGMGRAALFLLLRLGAQVMVCGRNGEKLEKAADDAERLLGSRPLTHAMTIRDPEQVGKLADAAFEKLGKVDHLVNCAGGQFPINILDLTPKGWNAVIDTNLNGSFWMIQAFGKRWVERGEPGNIVTLTMVTDRGIPQSAHSAAARAGVLHLTKSLAVEWAPHNIRLNCIAPGTVVTEGLNEYPEVAISRHGKGNPMKRMGDTWDIAEAIAWLCSPAADFVTGEFLHIDGGMQLFGTNWPLGVPEYFQGM